MDTRRFSQTLFMALQAVFRRLPMGEAYRDRLRQHFLSLVDHWRPPMPVGRAPAGNDQAAFRLLERSDEPAIGHRSAQPQPLPDPLPARLVAFYLPQFHPFAENDAWWGKGFTEWRNVTRALPQFQGHHQPRLPADLGFYDLRHPGVMRQQAQLAASHGITAFCFYFYWFAGKTLMEAPLQQWLQDKDISLSFCLCWANENWSRRWDGRDDDVLIAQQHCAEDDLAFIAHVADYLRDSRALKVDGRPVLLLYRPQLLPDPRATALRWRQWCRDNGVGEIHLAYVQGFERPDPADIGFDAAVEFPPNMSNPPSLTSQQQLINPAYRGDVRDWRELAREMASRSLPAYRLYPGVNPGWDNEPRRPGRGRTFLHASPRGYRDWLSDTIHQRLAGVAPDQRLVFINAWNEWAEGAVLEPDARLGHAWLQATARALHPPGDGPCRGQPCALVQTADTAAFRMTLQALKDSRLAWRVVASVPAYAEECLRRQAAEQQCEVEFVPCASADRQTLALLEVADRLHEEGHDILLRLAPDADACNNLHQWLAAVLEPCHAAVVIDRLARFSDLGAVVEHTVGPDPEEPTAAATTAWTYLQARCGLSAPPPPAVPTGRVTAGWLRLAALCPLLDAHLSPGLFAADHNLGMARALEHQLLTIIASGGYGTTCGLAAAGKRE